MSEANHTPKYKIIYNRLTGGIPFAASTAIDRITALADALDRRGAYDHRAGAGALASAGAEAVERGSGGQVKL